MAVIDPRYYYLTLGLLLFCTIVGLVIAFRFKREVDHDLVPSTEKELFGPLEKAYASGLMDEAEFQRIRASMQRRKTGESDPVPTLAPKRPAAPQVTEAPGLIRPDPLPETHSDDD